MKILVTGGAGFIGSHLAQKLKKENLDFVVLDNLHSGYVENLPENTAFVRMDVRDEKVITLLEKENFDAVVHLAAQTIVSSSLHDPFADADINISGGINILQACRKTGVKRVIFASSAAVYGDASGIPIKEDTSAIPTSFYGLSKLSFEKYLALYQKNFSLEYVNLRFANVYGERQGDKAEGGVISIFAKEINNGGGRIAIYGDGGQTRDFIHAEDIAAAIHNALFTKRANTTYNVSNKKETSVNELLQTLCKITKNQITPRYENARLGDIYRSMLDNSKALTHLDWSPQVSLVEGLERTCTYFKKAGCR